MKALHIRDVDPDVVAALKRLARSHRRSLQGELLAILDRAAKLAPPETEMAPMALVTVQTGGRSSWSREEIYGDQAR